jgi:hypothetical protein
VLNTVTYAKSSDDESDSDEEEEDEDSDEEGDDNDDDDFVAASSPEWHVDEEETYIGTRTAVSRYYADQSRVKCHNCDQYGHFQRDCPAPRVCVLLLSPQLIQQEEENLFFVRGGRPRIPQLPQHTV